MRAQRSVFAALVVASVACATAPPESPSAPTPAPSAPTRAPAALPESAAAPPSAALTDAGGDGCAEESETVPVVIATQHAKGGRKGGFVAKLQAPLIKANETLLDTTALKGGYTCCVLTEVESVRFECELPDGPTLGRVYRDKDELVVNPGEGHEVKRLPIPCGAWLRFRGPAKECETSPP